MVQSLLISLLLIAGFLIGAFDAVVSGGNLMTLSILNLLCSSPLSAIATMQVVTFFQTGSAFIAFARKKLINWEQTLPFCLTAVVASLFGANITLGIDQKLLTVISGLLMLSLLFFIPKIKSETELDFPLGLVKKLLKPILHKKLEMTHNWKQTLILHTIIFFISLYGGFFGAGIGVMLLIAVLMVSDANIPVAIANTKLIDVSLSLSASMVFAAQANLINWQYFIPLAIGSSIGSFVGADFAKDIDRNLLRLALYLLVILSAVKLLSTLLS